jgi:hypothetical protein
MTTLVPGAAGSSQDALTPSPRMSHHRLALLRRPKVWFSLLVAILLVALIGLTVYNGNSPTEVVRRYLEAIRAGDVDAALAEVSPGAIPGGEQSRLLRTAVPDGNWSVTSLRARTGLTGYGATSHVEAEISLDGHTVTGDFGLTESDGDIAIGRPFVYVTPPATPLGHLQVDGQTVALPYPGPFDDSSSDQVYALLPGRHSLYGDQPDGVTLDAPAPMDLFTATTDEDPIAVPAPKLVMSDEYTAQAQRHVETLIDDCSDTATLTPYLCPFKAEDDIEYHGHWLHRPTKSSWQVVKYPTVALVDSRKSKLMVTAIEPGTVQLHGNWYDSNDQLTEVIMECPIDVAVYRARIDSEGELTVRYAGFPSGQTFSECEAA